MAVAMFMLTLVLAHQRFDADFFWYRVRYISFSLMLFLTKQSTIKPKENFIKKIRVNEGKEQRRSAIKQPWCMLYVAYAIHVHKSWISAMRPMDLSSSFI